MCFVVPYLTTYPCALSPASCLLSVGESTQAADGAVSPAAVVLVNTDPIDALSRLRINYALILPPLYNSNNVYIQG